MDPNETLRIMRNAITLWENAPSGSREEADMAESATSAAAALDDWMSRGGFPPDDWRRVPPTAGIPLDIDLTPADPGPAWKWPAEGTHQAGDPDEGTHTPLPGATGWLPAHGKPGA